MTVTFFGHANTSPNVQPVLESVLKELIQTRGANRFYVGHNGAFDVIVRRTLEKIVREEQSIDYAVVLAYLPSRRQIDDAMDYTKTLFPECLENTPPRYAIDKRNRWMIQQADLVVTYVTTPFGGAAKFKQLSERKGKEIINLAGR